MDQLSSFLFASVLLTLTPGPDLLMVIAKSLEKGIGTALYFTAGLMTGLCGHTLFLVLGWAQFVGERPDIVMGFKIAGCVYFSYLGLKSIYSYFKKENQMIFESTADKSDFKQGLMMNLLNPKVSLFFWLFFPGFLFSENWSIEGQYVFLGLLFLIQASFIFSIVAIFSAQFKRFFSRYSFGLISGLLWIMIGVYLVFS